MPTYNDATCAKCSKPVENVPDYLAKIKDLWLCKSCTDKEGNNDLPKDG